MPQGFSKVKKARKPATKKKLTKKVRPNKPAPSKKSTETTVTKSINKRIETVVAAKAISVGTNFFLSDVAQKGKKEHDAQIKERNKKQKKRDPAEKQLQQLKR
jgi:hypothetical protein